MAEYLISSCVSRAHRGSGAGAMWSLQTTAADFFRSYVNLFVAVGGLQKHEEYSAWLQQLDFVSRKLLMESDI